jgi:3-oxoacyl-[acyl-carrier-protein] synthase II
MQDRIVITGMGTVNPLGLNAKESWENAVAGRTGVAPITLFDSHKAGLQVHVAAEVKNFKPENFMDPKEARRRDRFEQFAIAAAKEALDQSGLEINDSNAGRIGVIISSAIGGLTSLQEAILTNHEVGPRKVSPFFIPMLMANGGAGMTAIEFGIKGPCFSVASACASGADGIGTALMMLRSGMIDAAFAGAAECTLTSTGVAAFDRVGATSRKSGITTPQPFDKNRDGLVMGEGAAVFVLERETDAKARGANIFAELAGYGATADAYHVTAPHEKGVGGAAAIRAALDSAKANIQDVGYINAHGTGTLLNDQSETRAVKAAFGELAYKTPISSTKSMTGHMMGATGALEVIFCINAIKEGILPPTINYQTPDPECDLDYIPNKAREAKISLAISNAFGFGGHNSVLAIRKY